MKNYILKTTTEKQELLEKLSVNGLSLFFIYDEKPEGDFTFEAIGENMTLVNSPYSYKDLESWLYLGNWYASNAILKKPLVASLIQSKQFEVQNIMTEHGIGIFIDSYHDNIEWSVYEETIQGSQVHSAAMDPL